MTKQEFLKRWGKRITGENYNAALHNHKMLIDLEVLIKSEVKNCIKPAVIKSVCPKCGEADFEQKLSDIIDYDFENEKLLKISTVNYGEDGVGLTSDEINKLM